MELALLEATGLGGGDAGKGHVRVAELTAGAGAGAAHPTRLLEDRLPEGGRQQSVLLVGPVGQAQPIWP